MMTKTLIFVSMLVACHCLPQTIDESQPDIFAQNPAADVSDPKPAENQEPASTSTGEGDLDSILGQIFPGSEASSPPVKRFARADKEASTSTSAPAKDEKCTLENGQPGRCVHYYLCQDKIETPSDGLIEFRGDKSFCESYIDTCCSEKGISSESEVLKSP